MKPGGTLTFNGNHDSEFYHELKSRITPLIKRQAKKAAIITTVKLVLFPALFITIYVLLLKYSTSLPWLYFFYALLGIIMPFIVMNIVHDAMHKTLYKNATLNFLSRHFLDIIGANSFVWEMRHVHFHHPYTNIPDWDIDLEKKAFFHLSPADGHRKIYRYQHIYMLFIYPIFTLHWILIRDFKDFFDRKSMFRKKTTVRTIDYIKLILFKLFYLGYMLFIPMHVLPYSWYHYLGAFLVMQAFSGVITLMIVLPNHWDEDVVFPLASAANQINDSWAMHQLKSTNDFAIYHPFSNFVMGGLNHHVCHHLFPYVNHTLLPAVTKELVKISREKKLPYKCFTFSGALISHFRLLKRNGYQGNVLEEE